MNATPAQPVTSHPSRISIAISLFVSSFKTNPSLSPSLSLHDVDKNIMEPVGFSASLVTLLQVVSVAYELGQRIQHAPVELARVTSQLTILHTELHLLSSLEKPSSSSSSTWQLPEEIVTNLNNSLGKQFMLSVIPAIGRLSKSPSVFAYIGLSWDVQPSLPS